MKTFKIAALILVLFTACKTHKFVSNQSSDNPILDPNKKFDNEGQSEDYWAEELFKQKYRKEKFEKYNGKIQVIGDSVIYDKTSIQLYVDPKFKPLFTSGILYPQLLFLGSLRIMNFEELTFVNHSETVKRYRFWLFYKSFTNPKVYFMNPTVYFIELTNKNATNKTSPEDFIKDSELTYLKQGFVMI
jgi:hypothetical protein